MDLELQNLSQIVCNTFSEETMISLKTDLLSQKKLLKNLYNQLDSITIANGKIDKQYTVILQNAYRAIMAAREFFTKETIQYRIYYSSSNSVSSINKNVSIFELTEEDILNLTTLEGTALRLKSSFTKALNNKNHNDEREAIFDKHWNDIFSQMVQAEWTKQTVYRVTESIYLKYKKNKGLTDSSGKRYATFNRGNLYESFDATAEDVYKNINDVKNSINSLYNKTALRFEKKYFGQYLKHDQVKGFQTGDIGLIQLKARRAQLIELSTLKNYLAEIINILDLSANLNNKQKLTKKVKTLFTDPEIKKLKPTVQQQISYTVDQLLKTLN